MEKKIQIPLKERTVEAWFYSEGPSVQPGILFLPDLSGINDTLKESAELLAKEGYHVLLPDLYSEMGMARYCLRMVFDAACRDNHADAPPLQEVHQLVDYLKKMPEVNTDKIGVIGQCLTGGFILHMAIRPDVIAPVVFHHSFGWNGSGIPELDAKKICHPVQGHYVNIDPFVPAERVRLLREQLGDKLHYHFYNQLPHGIPHFFRRTEQGRRAWHTMLTFFRYQLDF